MYYIIHHMQAFGNRNVLGRRPPDPPYPDGSSLVPPLLIRRFRRGSSCQTFWGYWSGARTPTIAALPTTSRVPIRRARGLGDMRTAAVLFVAVCAIGCSDPDFWLDPNEICEDSTSTVTVRTDYADPEFRLYVRAVPPDGVIAEVVDAATPSRMGVVGGTYYQVPADGLAFEVTAAEGTAGQAVTFDSFIASAISPPLEPISHTLPIVVCAEPPPLPDFSDRILPSAEVSPQAVPCSSSSPVVVSANVPEYFEWSSFFVHVQAPAGVDAIPVSSPKTTDRTEAGLDNLAGAPDGTYYHIGDTPLGTVLLGFEIRPQDCVEHPRYVTFTVVDVGGAQRQPILVDTLRVEVEPAAATGGGIRVFVVDWPSDGDPGDPCPNQGPTFGLDLGKHILCVGG